MTTSFGLHPSDDLRKSYLGYQGQHSAKAKVLFVGFDPGCPPEIHDEAEPFKTLCDYFMCGVRWWNQKQGSEQQPLVEHHPSLLGDWGQIANAYHRPMLKILQMSKVHQKRLAMYVSFVEPLGVLTVGNISTNQRLYGFLVAQANGHLEHLNSWFADPAKTVFMTDGVAKFLISLANETHHFGKLRNITVPDRNNRIVKLPVPSNYATIFVHSFPSRGKLTPQEQEQMARRLAEALGDE